jgi:ABC-type sugar transport system, periplasmic component
MAVEMLGVYYNQELFEKAGITEVPKTFSQMKEVCEKLQASGITPFAATYKDAWTLNHLFSCLQGAAVGDYESWVADMNAGKGSFRNDNSSLEFEFMDMMKENSGGNYMDADSTSGFNAFASGEAAMIVTGEFSLLNAQSINPDLQVGLFGVPLTENEEDAKLDVDVGICIAVNQNTPHLDAVREVLNYLSDNTDENGWMHYSADSMGAAPPAMDFAMSTEYQYFEDYKNYMSNNQTKPWVYSQLESGAGDMIGPVIQGYFAGTTDMDTTLDQLDSKFSELLE